MATSGAAGLPHGAQSIEAVIFDLDGVITETADFHAAAWQRLAEEEELPWEDALADRLRGVSRAESLRIILDGREVDDEHFEEMLTRKNGYYQDKLDDLTPRDTLPGALEFVLACKRAGLKVAIGSSSRNARRVLGNLELLDLFDAISDGHSVEHAKPAPDLFEHAARQLGVPAERCVVVEDAGAGVEAANAAGMISFAVGPAERFEDPDWQLDSTADLDLDALFARHPRSLHTLHANVSTATGWEVVEDVFEPATIITTGSNYLTGNGFLGYRGTFPEWTAEEFVGCTVTDTWDNADGQWRELCTVPNALYARWSSGDHDLALDADARAESLLGYTRALSTRWGVHSRRWSSRGPDGVAVTVADDRVASMHDLHVVAQRQRIAVEGELPLTLRTGIDGDVWSLNGDHFASVAPEEVDDDVLLVTCRTGEEDLEIVVAQGLRVTGAEVETSSVEVAGRSVVRTLDLAEGSDGATVETFMVVTHGNEGADPRDRALEIVRRVVDEGYELTEARSMMAWSEVWDAQDLVIQGDLTAQTLTAFNLYHAIVATPAHSDRLPIGARGLSCQAYQGAAFWDQEIFNAPMFLYTRPEVARQLLQYRHATLDGARGKARRLGYKGAFYAWVSGDTGEELCPSFFFTDVLTGRPIRNHFNDWQMHVSPDIAYAIAEYSRATGDWGFVSGQGAHMLYEIARFCASFVVYQPVRGRYEVRRVLGPDEYHENVDDNAFTNHQIHYALELALELHERLAEDDPERSQQLCDEVGLADRELELWRDIHDRLHLPGPGDDGVIEQFSGYFALEDTTPAAVAERLQDPDEYWGWPNGVAVHTQVIKQADVVQLLIMHPDLVDDATAAANYDYYEPRTQHGSSLSPSAYAMLASRLGRVDEAYGMFMTSASKDLYARDEASPGGTFIGGIHTAACGATWQVLVRGFLGMRATSTTLSFAPHLPAHWEAVRTAVVHRGRRVHVEATPTSLVARASGDNPGPVTVGVAGTEQSLAPGEELRVTLG